MSMRIVCIGEKTEFGYIHIMTGVNCDDYEACLQKNEAEGEKPTTRTIKPECSGCGIAKPNIQPKQTP